MNSGVHKIYISDEGIENPTDKTDTYFADVVVSFESGQRYVATFFTFFGMHLMRKIHRQSGEYLDGKYFWTNSMLLIDSCDRKSIETVIHYLLEEGDFKMAFKKI